MRTWFIKEAYLTNEVNGVLVIKSKGSTHTKINDITVKIDHLNNCALEYTDMHWRVSIHSYINEFNAFTDGWNQKTDEPMVANINFTDVLPEYIEEKEYITESGFLWWYKKTPHKYCITKAGDVRLNLEPVKHYIVSQKWYIESLNEINTNLEN